MAAKWTDLVDPTRDEIEQAVRTLLPPEALDALVAPSADGRAALPRLEGHRNSALAVLCYPISVPQEDRVDYVEMDVVAGPDEVVTIRRTSPGGAVAPVEGVAARADAGAAGGELLQAAIDDSIDAFLALLDGLYESIDDLEDEIERLPGPDVRRRLTMLRNELFQARRVSSATRGVARRIVDGRVDVGRSDMFPPELQARFVDTYEIFVRVTEEIDVARDLLGGLRDYYQATLGERQNEVAKTLTVIASLVLVPSLIVGFYGQNFPEAYDDWYWTLGGSIALIIATTVAQLAAFRWRGWL